MALLSESIREFTGLTAITIVFLLAAGILIACNRTVGRKARNVFLCIVIALVFIAFADWVTQLFSGIDADLRLLYSLLMAITFAVAPFIPVFIANVIIPDKGVKWLIGILAVHAAVQVVNIWGGFIFWVDEGNVYHRGSLYPIYMAAYSLSAIYLVVESIRAGRLYQSMHIVAVLGILVCMLTGVLIQVFDSRVRMTWPAVSMAVVLYFMYYSDIVLRTDALTRLLNRRSYEDAFVKPPLPCVVVVIDVDNFKNVNDSFGHAYGDECLRGVAQMIRRVFGGAGLCYRTGGDEFAVIMTKRLSDVEQLADELANAAAAAQKADGRMPSVSVGFALADVGCKDFAAVFEAADQSMYQRKKAR